MALSAYEVICKSILWEWEADRVKQDDIVVLTIGKAIDRYFLPMLISSETLKQDLDHLDRDQLQQVADFIAFLKFRSQHRRRVVLDPTQLATLFTEFADEDRALAETGMSDYAAILHKEDQLLTILEANSYTC